MWDNLPPFENLLTPHGGWLVEVLFPNSAFSIYYYNSASCYSHKCPTPL